MNETFGQRFYKLRREKGLTQEEIASRVNISAQAVSKWENDASMPDIAILGDLGQILGVSVDTLLGVKDNHPTLLSAENRKDPNELVMRIRIVSADGDKVNVNLPVPLLSVCMQAGMSLPNVNGRDALANIDLGQVLALAEKGVVGEIISVRSAEGDDVSIIIE